MTRESNEHTYKTEKSEVSKNNKEDVQEKPLCYHRP